MSKKDFMAKSFSKFKPTTKNEWLSAVRKSLSNAQPETLDWAAPSGFIVEPIYTKNELTSITYLPDFQANATGGLKQPRKWEYREFITIKPGEIEAACKRADTALTDGADGIIFDLNKIDKNKFTPEKLLKNFPFPEKSISFYSEKNITNVFDALITYLATQKAENLQGAFYTDPLAHWCISGQAYKKDMDALTPCIRRASHLPNMRCLLVRSDHFHNAGANTVQELAFQLNTAVAYLDELTNQGIDIKQIVKNMHFTVAIGSSYFIEISKLRALKILFAKVVQAYGEKEYLPTDVHIHAVASSFTKSQDEPYTNLVRNTSEAMSAILGGCHSCTLLPFDTAYDKSGELARRMSRNVSLLLKEEAHFDKVADPVTGTYYLAHLTDKLITNAWELFLKVEAMGGFTEAIQKGFIQEEIARSATNKISKITSGEKVIVGVNKYQNKATYHELGKPKKKTKPTAIESDFPLITPIQQENKS